MVDLTQAHKASIELLGTRHTALVEAVRNYVNGSVQPSIDELIAVIEDVTTDIDTKEEMLLGLASRQATKPVPSLILDFKTRHYLHGTRRPEKGYGIHDLLSVRRATPKWVWDSTGTLVEVPVNQPAYDHDPVTGEPRGLLLEDSRTNMIPRSNEFDRAVWIPKGSTITPAAGVGPDRSEASRWTSDDGATAHYLGVGVTLQEGVTYTISFFAKSAGAGKDRFTLFLQSGNSSEDFVATGEWKVFSHTFTASGSNTTHGISRPSNNSAVDVLIWGAQLERGPFPTSYIPTEGAPATRSADIVTRSLGEEFNPSAGTLFFDFEFVHGDITDNANDTVFELGGTNGLSAHISQSGGGLILLRYRSSARSNGYYRGTESRLRLAVSYDDTEAVLVVNGTLLSSRGKGRGSLRKALALMRGYSRVNSRLHDARYYSHALTRQELIDLTS